MKKPESNKIQLQACVTTVSFPSTLDALYGMIDKYGQYKTDMQYLLCGNEAVDAADIWWSVPRWLIKGDVLFFYHTKSALKHAQSLLTLARRNVDEASIALLEDSMATAEQYGGTIFAYTTITDPAEYLGEQEDAHFKGRIFAPIENIHIFENPASTEEFRQYIKISQGAITTLDKKAFEGLKKLLAAKNRLPDNLQQAEFGSVGFRDIKKNNWLTISTGENARFIHEAQVRGYFIDYLLNEIKDTRTPLYEECQCYRNGQRTGIADYFVKVGGHWLPVEAKLNIRSEKDILAQIRQYLHVDTFKSTRGSASGKIITADRPSLCLVIDNSGVYLTHNDKFAGCKIGKPAWKRQQLTKQSIVEIRRRLVKYLSC